ncbi:helix-turn-helix domain-containing protein [Saccharopolyspora spinosa]|uniref:Helix-turn-helix protein n=1 Tax=Saccharopolyspora spinosa TaxID=60894 RepID=A0A2N3XYH6_SACSN|nr:helix-turn-helix transcriptional regulator [Saccharopolyspora spinosa]PKW15726.1 helix-turn-helix protein [Saccharopolyspora spinosa]
MGEERRKLWNVGDTAGTPRTRALAAALRGALTDSGLTARQAGRLLDKSHSTISQWQNGKRVPTTDDVSAFLAVLGVTGKRRRQVLDLARNARESNWLAGGVSEQLAGIIECERTAVEIIDWCPLVVSGLLQIYDYASAIIGDNDGLSRAEVDSRVKLRLDRQTQLAERDGKPADYTVLIGEPALRQCIGGREVLLDQLRHVLAVTDWKGTTVQVVPTGGGWHPGLMGPFVIYGFVESPSIVAIENHRSSVFLYEDDDIVTYRRASAAIRRAALSPEESAAFIHNVITQVEDRE